MPDHESSGNQSSKGSRQKDHRDKHSSHKSSRAGPRSRLGDVTAGDGFVSASNATQVVYSRDQSSALGLPVVGDVSYGDASGFAVSATRTTASDAPMSARKSSKDAPSSTSRRRPPVPIFSPEHGRWDTPQGTPSPVIPNTSGMRDEDPAVSASSVANLRSRPRRRGEVLPEGLHSPSPTSGDAADFPGPASYARAVGSQLVNIAARPFTSQPTLEGQVPAEYAEDNISDSRKAAMRRKLGAAEFAPRPSDPGASTARSQRSPLREEFKIPMTNTQLVRHGEQWFLNGRQVPAPGNIDRVSNWRKADIHTPSPAVSPSVSENSAEASPRSEVSIPAARVRAGLAHSMDMDSIISPTGRTVSEAAQSTPTTAATSPAVSVGAGGWLHSPEDWERLFEFGQNVALGGTGLLGWPQGHRGI